MFRRSCLRRVQVYQVIGYLDILRSKKTVGEKNNEFMPGGVMRLEGEGGPLGYPDDT